MPTTLADIARATGLSKSGVSLALRHHASIPRATQARVEAIARRLNYRPNPLVAANMMHVRDVHRQDYRATLAFIWRGTGVARTYEFKPLVKGAVQKAAELGFSVDPIDMSADHLNVGRLNQILKSRSIRAVILAGMSDQPDDIALDWENLCVTVIGYTFPALPVHRVAFDTYSAVAGALERVALLGYSRVGFVMLRDSLRRYYGAPLASYDYFKRNYPFLTTIPPLLVSSIEFREFNRWFKRYRPDVILSNHWFEVQTHLEALALKIPEDVGYTGIANLPRAASVSGFHQRYESLGAAAVTVVSQMFIHGEFGAPATPTTTLLKGVWSDGCTLRQPTGAAS